MADATIDPKLLKFVSNQTAYDVDILARQIEQQLKKGGFCVVFDDELERYWPLQTFKRAERERQIQAFAESHGWSASIANSDFGPRAIFMQNEVDDAFVRQVKTWR